MLIGPSGSGKTTLLSVLAGIIDRDNVACTVLDCDFQQLDATERALKKIGRLLDCFVVPEPG